MLKMQMSRPGIMLIALIIIGIQPALSETSPTQAYLELHKKELAAKSYSDLVPLHSKSSLANDKMSKEEQEQMFPLFKSLLVKDVTVTKEIVNGDSATLEVKGAPEKGLKPGDTETIVGTILLSREDGEWKLDKEKWNSKVDMH
jgi:hypothetical protein